MSVEFAFSHMIIINYHMFIMMFITVAAGDSRAN